MPSSSRPTTGASERTPLLSSPPSDGPAPTADAASEDGVLGNVVPEDLSDPQALTPRTRNLVLVSVWCGVFLGAVDATVVASLVTDISASFESSNQASWLGTSYLLSTACFTPLYGRLADIIGRRYSALLALSLFLVGTALCGLAPTMNLLIVGRLIAGMGGGGLMAISSIVASDLVPLKKRALVQGIANLFFGAGSGLGGPMGGLISDWAGWRVAFLAQLPLLVASLAMVLWKVRYRVPGQGKSKREMLRRIDYMGAITLIIANNEALPWSHPLVWSLLTVAIVFAVLFVLVEKYWAFEPVMPLRILMTRNGLSVAFANFCMSFVTFSILYFYPAFFEVIKGLSASQAGAHLLPNSIALSCGSLFAGWYIRHTGRYYNLIAVTSFLPILALVSAMTLNEHRSPFNEWLGIIPAGFGFASLITATLVALIASVDRSDMATATGITYLARYIGQVVGVAISSSLLQAVLNVTLHRRITGPDAEKVRPNIQSPRLSRKLSFLAPFDSQYIDQIRHVSTSIPSLPPSIQPLARSSYLDALRAVFILNAIVAGISFLSCLPLKEFPLPDTFKEEEERRRENENARLGRVEE
ncbi:BZ3500_MvSof-1268-A1-R1_Chr2-1g04272 [Microbotryum saponariae]|uniref:BZ3500_MvSof-1268-A1-R1_Chr2-1g04272 protein n=1 Tax=Microbotryum saponariae TaxID=289078 RepID=A0A2X0KD69_9BASI|nr:BZ3500_MvSof-1268-A1-R1_Chr2-1g04272 [Microbotryum saponariae]SCZ91282.1 BZ3501_MvSof-1269-A2-R1_Chr2-1g03928 [Microbotryum saponariae]